MSIERPNHPDNVLYLVSLNPEPGYEDKFNEWYNTQHVPELLDCPGFRHASRFELVDGIDGSLRYLAVYDMESMAAFDSAQYRGLRARTADELTPLAAEVAAHRSRDLNAKYRQIFRMSSPHHD